MEYAAVAVWWVLFAALAVAGAPVAAALLGALPDRGAGLAIPAGLTVVFLGVYWVGRLAYGPGIVTLGFVGLLAVAAAAVWLGPGVARGRLLEALAVFTAGYLLVVGIRAFDPAVLPLGGEKFLDYGLLNAVLRADRLPPEDMWFAGEPVSYYYGGHLLAGSLAALAGTPARFAYNLALAGFYGTLVAAAYGLAGSLTVARGGPYRLGGLAGAGLVGVASNLVPVLSVVLWGLPRDLAEALAAAVAGRTALEAASIAAPVRFSYWTASRVVPGTINEFPLFAWLNGDLHAHMLSTPFLLAAAAVAFAYTRTPADALARRRLLVLGALPPVAGLLAVVNTWSFPSAVGLVWLGLALGPADPTDLLPARLRAILGRVASTEAARLASASLLGVVALGLGVAWVLPFFLGPASARTLGVLPDRSGLLAFLLVHGAFVGVFGCYLAALAGRAVGPRRGGAVLAGVGAAVVVGVLLDAAAVAVLVPLVAVAWYLLRRGDHTVGFEAVLIVAGAGLALIVEFVFVQEQAGPGRMNTVFKTYMQVWVLWGTAAGAVLVDLVRPAGPGATSGRRWRRAAPIAGAVLIVALSVYGAVALSHHVEAGDRPTLDATTAIRAEQPDEWAVIAYLAERHPDDRPTVVSAPGCWCHEVEDARPYSWANAPSSFTGLPTVAGWSHEVGYRGETAYARRVGDVRTIYTGAPSNRAALLAEYDVRYVVVGPTERALYGDPGFDGQPGVSVAFRSGRVTLYRVDAAGP